MWLLDAPNVDDELRQGDLLLDVPFPLLNCPIEPSGEGNATFAAEIYHALVIAQCCTVQQRKVAALAPVKETAVLAPNDRYLTALLTDEYPIDPHAPYVNHKFRLNPNEFLQPRDGAHKVADLVQVTSFRGDLLWLQKKRAARMSVIARRNLRTKLAIFWGRPEAEDAQLLQELGATSLNLPSGIFGAG